MTDLEKVERLPAFLQPIVKMILEKYPMEDLPQAPERGVWYKYRTNEAFCGNGEPYAACIKLGKVNNLLIVFCGGGVSINEYTAAHPNNPLYPDPVNFYADDVFMQAEIVAPHGLGNNESNNPFKDWTVLLIPYATGDFHVGTNDFVYKSVDGQNKVLHHRGYDNYRILIEKIKEFVVEPNKLLVTGFSAGGFATALLTDDIMERFPNCKDVTCFPDAALLEYEGWYKTAIECWKAPKEIADRLVTENITLDSLTALYRKRPNVKIAFASSYRDALLAQYQHFADTGEMRAADSADGDKYTITLKRFCQKISKEIPNISLFIYDAPHEGGNPYNLTKHGLNMTDDVYKIRSEDVTCIDWLCDAMNGKNKIYGLQLLGE